MTATLAQAGGAVGALGLLALMVAAGRLSRIAGFAAWAFGMAALAVYLAPHGHRGALAGAAVVGLIGAAAGAAILVRWPRVLPFVALALVPARIPVHVGETQANLLLPLYAVVAAAAFALFWSLPTEPRRAQELGPLAWPLGLWIGWTGLSLIWTKDLRQGAIELIFFVLPFGLLAVSLARLRWSPRGLAALLAQLTAMALVFAVVGLYQWFTRDVFWNPGVRISNAYAPFFRVNAVFYDPSVYGRFLAVAIVAIVVVVLYGVSPRLLAAATAAIGLIWAGLLVSFSQSSFAALIIGCLVATALVWRRRAIVLAVVAIVAIAAVGLATPHIRHTLLNKTTSSWDNATSGRASLVANGIRIAVHHPAAGVGVGGFKRAYADRTGLKGKEPKRAASHNSAVTVAAETGAPGLVLLVWLVVAALVATARAAGASHGGKAAAWTCAAIAAIVAHSLFYAALFEDATFWGLLAGVALWSRSRSASATSAASTTPVSG